MCERTSNIQPESCLIKSASAPAAHQYCTRKYNRPLNTNFYHPSMNLSLASTFLLLLSSNASVAFGSGVRGGSLEEEQGRKLGLVRYCFYQLVQFSFVEQCPNRPPSYLSNNTKNSKTTLALKRTNLCSGVRLSWKM